ncbi:MAG: phosphatase PAP2 family protein [Anaerolineae bacterium]|nr:phosphatase PAP2 family protein [Anaerolineae bacterium]
MREDFCLESSRITHHVSDQFSTSMTFIRFLDHWLFGAINSQAGQWPWLDRLARLLLNDYFVPTVLALMLLALWFEQKNLPGLKDRESLKNYNRQAVLTASLSAALANALLKIINLLYFRPRPFAGHAVNLLFYRPSDSSFPSNAAALGFAIAAGVWFYNRAWGWGLLALAALFGLSRILGGVHYPFDVLAGAVLGWGSAWLIRRQQRLVEKLLGLIEKTAGRWGLA